MLFVFSRVRVLVYYRLFYYFNILFFSYSLSFNSLIRLHLALSATGFNPQLDISQFPISLLQIYTKGFVEGGQKVPRVTLLMNRLHVKLLILLLHLSLIVVSPPSRYVIYVSAFDEFTHLQLAKYRQV